jgi:hypothetical protein
MVAPGDTVSDEGVNAKFLMTTVKEVAVAGAILDGEVAEPELGDDDRALGGEAPQDARATIAVLTSTKCPNPLRPLAGSFGRRLGGASRPDAFASNVFGTPSIRIWRRARISKCKKSNSGLAATHFCGSWVSGRQVCVWLGMFWLVDAALQWNPAFLPRCDGEDLLHSRP